MENLSNIQKRKEYIIKEIKSSSDDFIAKMNEIGFVSGQVVKLIRRAPLFGDPLLFKVGNSNIALTKAEAKGVHVISGEC